MKRSIFDPFTNNSNPQVRLPISKNQLYRQYSEPTTWDTYCHYSDYRDQKKLKLSWSALALKILKYTVIIIVLIYGYILYLRAFKSHKFTQDNNGLLDPLVGSIDIPINDNQYNQTKPNYQYVFIDEQIRNITKTYLYPLYQNNQSLGGDIELSMHEIFWHYPIHFSPKHIQQQLQGIVLLQHGCEHTGKEWYYQYLQSFDTLIPSNTLPIESKIAHTLLEKGYLVFSLYSIHNKHTSKCWFQDDLPHFTQAIHIIYDIITQIHALYTTHQFNPTTILSLEKLPPLHAIAFANGGAFLTNHAHILHHDYHIQFASWVFMNSGIWSNQVKYYFPSVNNHKEVGDKDKEREVKESQPTEGTQDRMSQGIFQGTNQGEAQQTPPEEISGKYYDAYTFPPTLFIDMIRNGELTQHNQEFIISQSYLNHWYNQTIRTTLLKQSQKKIKYTMNLTASHSSSHSLSLFASQYYSQLISTPLHWYPEYLSDYLRAPYCYYNMTLADSQGIYEKLIQDGHLWPNTHILLHDMTIKKHLFTLKKLIRKVTIDIYPRYDKLDSMNESPLLQLFRKAWGFRETNDEHLHAMIQWFETHQLPLQPIETSIFITKPKPINKKGKLPLFYEKVFQH